MQRYDIINHFIKRYHYASYLEIGCKRGECFREIKLADKTSVDPVRRWRATAIMTSDEFFKNAMRKWDIIFIDGLHEEFQVDRDIHNSLDHLNENGTIVVHDCNPLSYALQVPPERMPRGKWNGTVWRSFVKFRAHNADLEMYTVDVDHGCGIIRRGVQQMITLPARYDYDEFNRHRREWLNLICVEEFLRR